MDACHRVTFYYICFLFFVPRKKTQAILLCKIMLMKTQVCPSLAFTFTWLA